MIINGLFCIEYGNLEGFEFDNLVCVDDLQPGPREVPHQCLIKRNKKTSTFYLYLALSPCK